MAVFENDTIATGDGEALVALFPRGWWDRPLSSFEAPIFNKWGATMAIREYPIPSEQEAGEFLRSMPPKLQQAYMDAVRQVGREYYLGRDTRMSMQGAVVGRVRYSDVSNSGWRLNVGPKEAERLVRDSQGWHVMFNEGWLVTGLGYLLDNGRPTARWRPWHRHLGERGRAELEEWKKQRAVEVGARAVGGLLLEPVGTDYAVECDAGMGRMVVGVHGGKVRCYDLDSGTVATLEPGEKLSFVDSATAMVGPMPEAEWTALAAATQVPGSVRNIPPGGAAWDLPDLQADVLSVRTFESGTDHIPYGRRQYRQQYSAADARFICWELRLAFARPQRRIDFDIEAVYRAYDGREVGRAVHAALLEPQWTEPSVHDHGWKPEVWTPGAYRVDLYAGGVFVGCSSFEITAPGQAAGGRAFRPTLGVVTPLQARVTGLGFYEGGKQPPPAEDPHVLSERFPSVGPACIYWLLSLEHPAPGRRTDFTIQAVYRGPEGQVLTEQTVPSHVEAGRTSSKFTYGWGLGEGEEYQVGVYRVDLSVEGELIARGNFQIVP
jgi:hypothetical protein